MTLQRLSQWLQYLYFLRFSLLAWLFLPLLVILDGFGKTTALTRGIMTMDSSWQAFYAAFFVLALNMTVLVTARNTVMNGIDRFKSKPPRLLQIALCSTDDRAVWLTLLTVHIPTCIALGYLGYIAKREAEEFGLYLFGRSSHYVWIFLAFGVLVGLLFWYLVSLFYYWTYTHSANRPNPAALIFPDHFFGDINVAPHPYVATWLESAMQPLLRLTCPGYALNIGSPFWELHFLSTVSLIGFLLLYLFLYPATAPIVRHTSFYLSSITAFLIAILFLVGVKDAQPGTSRWAPYVKRTFQILAIALLAVFLWGILYSDHYRESILEMAFPTLASILVIATFFLWLLAGAGFFFDRYRLPVLTLTLAFLFLPKIWHWGGGEHFYSVRPLKSQAIVPTAEDALRLRITGKGNPDEDKPYIIITASGGGIHAAAWTAQVMARLEEDFANDPTLNPADHSSSYTFHDHILLASGVSGGSVGLMPYLLEYAAPKERAFADIGKYSFHARVTEPPACSGLEAVAWGLEYYDLYRFLFNFTLPDSWTSEDAPDRSWALSAAFNRNLHDRHCRTKELSDQPDGDFFTLSKASDLLGQGRMPAFTFNTTAAETGNRFLLSDYQVPPPATPRTDFLPAESFLQAYAQDGPCSKPKAYADLPLATAAKLSATFPYVSSGTRIPKRYTEHAYHFLDGGYFDNDGTGSVIEFLKSAIDPQMRAASSSTSTTHCESNPGKPLSVMSNTSAEGSQERPVHRLKILLIEIRDGEDLGSQSDDDLAHQNEKATSDWTAITQLLGPPIGLWNAGHNSISRRNRRELCLLETAYREHIHIHHVVFSIRTPTSRSQPLSWHLTAHQRSDIDNWAARFEIPNDKNSEPAKTQTQTTIDSAIKWVTEELQGKDSDAVSDVCTTH